METIVILKPESQWRGKDLVLPVDA
jgi:hypothetical protein